MKIDFAQLADATRLVRTGKLQAATALIQTALAGQRAADSDAPATNEAANDVIDVPARVVGDARQSTTVTLRNTEQPEAFEQVRAPSRASMGRFVAGVFSDARDRRDYKLYVPAMAGSRALPLIVMLHGCTQDPDDFAAGTAMNELAEVHGFYVLYPAQSRRANPQGCWNWFKHSHQKRGRGEPALLAGLTQRVMAEHRVDPRHVYVAGLSAGGAMAAIVGDAYPELFAAVGVHSGLPTGSALDLPSALSAMKGGAKLPAGTPSGVPTIVFHGDADGTVHPSNGEHVIAACAGAISTVELGAVEGAGVRKATRAIYRNEKGQIIAERWTIHGAAHAWSGGRPAGSYTDARGPDASAQMLRFFLEHPHAEEPLHQAGTSLGQA